MERKPWYLSKTFWSLLITALVTFWDAVRLAVPGLPDIPPEVRHWLQALGLLGAAYGRAVADRPLGLRAHSRTR